MELARLSLVDRLNNNNILWMMTVPDDYNLITGLVVAGLVLLQEYARNHAVRNRYALAVAIDDPEAIIIDDYDDFFLTSDLIVVRMKKEQDVQDYPAPEVDNMRVWVWSAPNDWIPVDTLHMDLFLQGFITMCSAFQVDFRDYLLGPPVDSNGTQYDIPTYRLREYFSEERPDIEYEEAE